MFGRAERKHPLEKTQSRKLEDLRDDCIALFINSGLTQKDIHHRGGPTPGTISRWLYKETFFPRYDTLERFLLALDYELMPVSSSRAAQMREGGRTSYLEIDLGFVGRPRMPQKRKK
jgi:hypothetical protein